MAKKIIKVEDEPKAKKKTKVDLSKIGQVISENRGTIEVIANALLGTSTKKTRRTTTKTGTTRKRTTKSSKSKSSGLDAVDILGSLLKK